MSRRKPLKVPMDNTQGLKNNLYGSFIFCKAENLVIFKSFKLPALPLFPLKDGLCCLYKMKGVSMKLMILSATFFLLGNTSLSQAQRNYSK